MSPAETSHRASTKATRESLELLLAQHLRAERIAYTAQHHFWPGRKWRLDFAFPGHLLAVEVQGGTWIKGAHSSGAGIERDCEKAAHLAIAGWRLIPVTGGQIKSGLAIRWIKDAIKRTTD